MPDSKHTAVIFIHGFCSNTKSWNKMNKLISDDSAFKKVKVDFFSYPTGILKFNSKSKLLSRMSSIGSVQMLSRGCSSISELANQLNNRIENEFNDYDDIALVGHSMGGIIARKYLMDHNNAKVTKLILYASPVRGTRFATILSSFLKTNFQLNDLKRNSELLEKLNSIQENQINFKKVKVINIVTPFDQYVSVKELNEYWKPGSDEFYILKNKIHFSINSPKNAYDESYCILRNCIMQND